MPGQMSTGKFQLIAITVMVVAGAAYLVFLAASWNQMQADRVVRDRKINDLLDTLKPREDVKADDKPAATVSNE